MPNNHSRSFVFTAGVALAASAFLAACSRQEAPPEPVRAVKVVTLGAEQAQQQTGLYAGEVRARVESRLGFRVAGKLTQRTVDAGQRVAAGQLLAAMDPQDYQLSAQAAQAQLLAAQSQRDVALADYKRFESLKAQGFISGAELERREASLKAAEAALVQARSQSQAQANQVGYAQLQATAAGVITGLEAVRDYNPDHWNTSWADLDATIERLGIDYDEVEQLAKEHHPKLIVAGASAYPRIIDFARMGEIAREVGAEICHLGQEDFLKPVLQVALASE